MSMQIKSGLSDVVLSSNSMSSEVEFKERGNGNFFLKCDGLVRESSTTVTVL